MSQQEDEGIRCCGPAPSNTGHPVRREDGTTIYVCSESECAAWRRNRDPDRIRAGISEYGGHCGLAEAP